MEIDGKDGSNIQLKEGLKKELGRGLGFVLKDRTVSRRHVSFQLLTSDHKDETRVCFEVIGKNPIWVHDSKAGEIRDYRKFERGEMESGDMFSVSAKKPAWFTLKRMESEGESKNEMDRGSGVENELAECLQSSFGLRGIEELELESIDVSNFVPVKEFGFIVLGHEFDEYPKKMIRDIKKWDWFLKEPGEESENDEGGERKRKKGGGGEDDDEWTIESEEDKALITRPRKVQRPTYLTRSTDNDRPVNGAKIGRNSQQKNIEEEDEYDETLGGFIVGEEDTGEEVERYEDGEEEEEDFDEDDDEEE